MSGESDTRPQSASNAAPQSEGNGGGNDGGNRVGGEGAGDAQTAPSQGERAGSSSGSAPGNAPSRSQRSNQYSGQRRGNIPPPGPRKVRHGVKLKPRDGQILRTEVSGPWLDLIERWVPTGERDEGRRYAQLGQTRSMEIEPARIVAAVQGARSRAYATRLHIQPFDEDQWAAFIEALAGEAVHLVKLAAGELPPGIESVARPLGLTLLPSRVEDVRGECTCGRAMPCRHVAAIADLVAEQLANDALLVFRLRGLPVDQLLERLRHARALRTRGEATAHVDPLIPESREEAEPLEDCLDWFWRPGTRLAAFHDRPAAPFVSHALLRRMGPPPMAGRFPLVGLLASIYDDVSRHAVALRDMADRVEAGDAAPASATSNDAEDDAQDDPADQ